MDKAVFEYLHNIGYNKGQAVNRLHEMKDEIKELSETFEAINIQEIMDSVNYCIEMLELD